MSFPRRRESTGPPRHWIPAFAGMTRRIGQFEQNVKQGGNSMPQPSGPANCEHRAPWWRSIGPALITACVVFGPGSLLINSNVGAKYGYDLLWMLLLTGLLMGTYTTTAARVGVVGGATP